MFGIGIYGGNIIDADRQRATGDERDSFEELTQLINLENTANYTSVTVLNDGTNGQPAVVRATGPDDLLDYINASSVVTGLGFAFPSDADDRDLPIDVQTDYILEPGKSYVRIETTITNNGNDANGLSIFFGDIANGSGQVELFEPAYGFGEPLVTTSCPANSFKPCATGTCNPCNFVAWSGEDKADGVSYAYITTFNKVSNFNTSGVTAVLLGQDVTFVLIGAQSPNAAFHMAPSGSPGDAITVTRYFAVGDGSVASIEDARNEIQGVTTGTLSGHVTSGGQPLGNADVAVLGTPVNQMSQNVVDHFRTAADGSYRGTLAPGNYNVRANKDGRLFGTPDPAPITITAAATTMQDFDLPAAGGLRVTVTDQNGAPIPAKVQLVGFDPSPDPRNTQSVLGLVNNVTGVFGEQIEDGLAYGIAFVTFADRTGDTGVSEVEPGTYQLAVSHGPRYSGFTQPVTITAGATTTVAAQLARVVATPGFVASDHHVHSIDSPDSEVTREERVATMLADGMDFFTPSDHDFRSDFGPTLLAMGVTDLISTATSAEITTFDYGHFNAWPVPVDPSKLNGGGVDWGRAGIAPGMDFPSLGSFNLSPAEIYAAAHLEAPLIQINHMRSHFNTDGLTIDTATVPPQSATPPAARRLDPSITNLFDAGFDALEVWIGTDGRTGDLQHFLGENLGDWFNMLNQGILKTGVADSDTHQRRTTQMNARTYVASAVTDPGLLTPEAQNLAANVIAGKAIGTNAPFVTVSVNAPSTGETAALDLAHGSMVSTSDGVVNVTVTVSSPAWAEFDRIQFFVNNAPQAYDHDNDAGTPDRYRVFPNFEAVAGTDFTVVPMNDFPSIPGASHLTATYTLPLTLTADSWIVVVVRGTDGTSHPLFPFMPNSLRQSGNTTLANLTDGNLNEDGLLALAFTNPLYVDANNDHAWTPPGVMLTP